MKKALMIASILFIAVVSTACINNIAVQELNNKAAEYMEKGDYESAMDRLQASLDLDATMYETYYNLGIAAINAKKYDKAIEALEGGIKIKPDYADFYYSLGLAQSDLADELMEPSEEDDSEDVSGSNKDNDKKITVSDEDIPEGLCIKLFVKAGEEVPEMPEYKNILTLSEEEIITVFQNIITYTGMLNYAL